MKCKVKVTKVLSSEVELEVECRNRADAKNHIFVDLLQFPEPTLDYKYAVSTIVDKATLTKAKNDALKSVASRFYMARQDEMSENYREVSALYCWYADSWWKIDENSIRLCEPDEVLSNTRISLKGTINRSLTVYNRSVAFFLRDKFNLTKHFNELMEERE